MNWPLGDGFYRANVPSRNGACQFEAKCRCQCECQTCPQRNEKAKRQASSPPCDKLQILLGPITGLSQGQMTIQNKTIEVLVGHKIHLTIDKPGQLASINWTWTASTQVLSDYTMNTAYGQYEVPSEEQRTSPLIDFYFPLPGTFDVWCDYTLLTGSSCRVLTTFQVYRPGVILETKSDIVRVTCSFIAPTLCNLGLGYVRNTPGITFKRLAVPDNVPPSLSSISGEYEVLQVIHYIKLIVIKNCPRGNILYDDEATGLLDSQKPPFLDANNPSAIKQDTPNLDMNDKFKYFGTIQQFRTYLFWRPSKQDGWVPLRQVYWGWTGEAEIDFTGKWILRQESPLTSTVFPDYYLGSLGEFPHWNGWSHIFLNVKYLNWRNSDCPYF